MDTLGFLQRVLPSEGFYVTTVINPDSTRQGFFKTIEDLEHAITASDKRGNNTYYAIASYNEKGSRKQDNVHRIKTFALDVDCGEGKPYPDWEAGILALSKFVRAMKLPKPMIVHSGNGLHVYWVLQADATSDEWKPIAEALKVATIEGGFAVDAGLTANSALVLRPIGTHNPKNGKEVRLLMDAPPISIDMLRSILTPYIRMPRAGADTGAARTSKLAQALAVESTLPPANGVVVMTKCQQINWAVKNQADVPEPLWYSLLGVAAYCIDPEETAIAWSENHPKFDAQQTIDKLHRWKSVTTGPSTCTKFEADRPGGCKGCRFKDKIGSPARLGVQYQEVVVSDDAADQVATEIQIPRPFKRTADGIKITIEDSDIDVCKFDLYPVSYGRDESLGYETVRYHWKRPHVGWQELSLRQAYLADGSREFAGAIADQGIVLNNKTQTGLFQLMLRNYMDELRNQRAMTNLYATMGWKDNFTQFVIGDTLIRRMPDGTVGSEAVTLSATTSKLGHELYTQAGDPKEWTAFTKLTEKAKLFPHMFAICVGFSAPLYAFTGLKGLTISLYGPTGGGKTLAQLWMQSIWGCPDKLHFAAKYTQNTLFNRMGLYSNMPMSIDEATIMADKEVGDFLYWVSQGRDKARLSRAAEERDARTFSLPVVVSTNKSMNSKLIASGLDTDAQVARLLEVTVSPSRMFTESSDAGRKIYNFLNNNHGVVGRQYTQKLLELGPAGIRAAVAEATEGFAKKYKADFSGEERYWEQALVLADLAGKFASDWGLIDFDHTVGIEWVLAQLGAIRRTVNENKVDAFDILSEYINENAAYTLTVFHQEGQRATVDHARLPRGSVYVRFDLYRKSVADYFEHGTVMLDRTHFRKWLAARGADYKSFTQELTDESVIATPRSQKCYLGKDSPIKLGQSYVIGVNLNHPRLQGILDKENRTADDQTYGQLSAVATHNQVE